MKKRIALFLVLVLCVSALSVLATAEESTAPSLDIAYYTGPMRATVSILYAVEYAGDVYLMVDGARLDAIGTLTKDLGTGEKTYLIFEYNLNANQMAKEVSAYATNGTDAGKTVTYSVNEFLDAYAAKYEGEESKANHVQLVKDMKAYGEAVAAWKPDAQ